MAYPYDLVSGDARRALEVFSDEFRTALMLSDVEEWAKTLGLYVESKAIKTTFPIPVNAAGYTEFKGDMKYRSLFERSLSMKTKEWQDGVEALARVIEAEDFIGWAEQPAALALEAKRQPNIWVASQLEANPNLDFYADHEIGVASTIAMFASSHPFNVFKPSTGTFDNDRAATGLNVAAIIDAKQHFREVNGANGRPLGLRASHLMVPPALEETAKDLLENDLLINVIQESGANVAAAAGNNRHKGTLQLVVADELTDSSVFYVLAMNKPGLRPWAVQTAGAPEEILMDKDSEKYKETRKVSIGYVLEGNAALALPHPIARYTIS